MSRFVLPGYISGLGLFLIFSCGNPKQEEVSQPSGPMQASIKLEEIPSSASGVHFANTIQDQGKINIFTWHFIYNGAGVAAGDINNDGLPDLYFAGNQTPDKLYLNKGDFHFEDITASAGIGTQIWSSGVSMADVNGDGLLDIYVCKNSPTGIQDNNRNKLYINQGKNVFREEAAKYGIDDIGFSSQATFFDADQDGDLDMYLVNQPFDEFARLVNRPDVVAAYPQTDRFFFFENGKFTDRIEQLGMKNARYGLNVSLGDFDRNGWTDLYICNDYHHGDHLYLNFNGQFKESVHTHTGHTSFYSMGSDVGDVNNDGWADIISLDMAYEDHYRSKTNMGSMDPDWFWSLVAEGQHYQYMQNVLQVNAGDGYFTDDAQIAGISKTDWSFASLLVDLDLDADQDLLISNGVLRDLRNNDFNKMVKDKYQGQVGPTNYLDILAQLPSTPVANLIYENDGQLRFSKLAPEAGFDKAGFSHGMVYTDLNNDGLPDVVVNNENAEASIYKNISQTNGHYLKIKLEGPGSNKDGLGCSVIVHANGQKQFNTMQTTRGYFSSVEPEIFVGLGTTSRVDSVQVFWNHNEMSSLKNVKADQLLHIRYAKEKKHPFLQGRPDGAEAKMEPAPAFVHHETPFNDYAQQVLLPYKLSQNGPFISTGDVNGDQREDFFIGGAAGQAGVLFLQTADGGFTATSQPAIENDKGAEDMESSLIDADGDGDLDLIIVSGSNEFKDNDPLLAIRVYLNDGKGHFSKAQAHSFPPELINGQCLEWFDLDGDGDLDVFIGGRLVSGRYAVPADAHLWRNDKGKFTDITKSSADFLKDFGMVTDAVADDVDKDGDMDLLVVGEWMAPTLMLNDGHGKFSASTIDAAGTGLWWTAEKLDADGDGDTDFLLGNLGWNNKFGGARGTKLEVYSNDFDHSGDNDVVLANQKGDKLLPVRGRECTSQEMPFILNKFPTYESYAKAQLQDIYSPDQLSHSVHRKLSTMSSILLRNDGNGHWSDIELPLPCQTGPIKAFLVTDVNNDQHPDFLYAGNHFPTEVETARYDGLYPGVCYGDGKGNFICKNVFIEGKLSILDARDLRVINVGNKKVYLMSVNDGQLLSFSF